MLDITKVYNQIKPELEAGEVYRQQGLNRLKPFRYLLYGSIGVAVLLFFVVPVLAVILLIVGLLIFAIKNGSENKKFKHHFQDHIVAKIIKGIGPDFDYERQGKIPQEIIENSNLFRDFNQYKSEDLVTGKINGKSFTYAEINLKKYEKSGSSKSSSTTTNIFSGIVFILELSLKIPAAFYINSSAEAKLLEKIAKWFPSLAKNRGTRLDTGYEPFESMYRVYSKEPDLIKNLLPPPILDRLMEINQKFRADGITQQDISFAFIGKQIFVAIPTKSTHKFMEPDLNVPINTPEFLSRQLMIMDHVHEVAEVF